MPTDRYSRPVAAALDLLPCGMSPADAVDSIRVRFDLTDDDRERVISRVFVALDHRTGGCPPVDRVPEPPKVAGPVADYTPSAGIKLARPLTPAAVPMGEDMVAVLLALPTVEERMRVIVETAVASVVHEVGDELGRIAYTRENEAKVTEAVRAMIARAVDRDILPAASMDVAWDPTSRAIKFRAEQTVPADLRAVGFTGQIEAEPTPIGVICSMCDTSNPARASYCGGCGCRLDEPRVARVGRQIAEALDVDDRCGAARCKVAGEDALAVVDAFRELVRAEVLGHKLEADKLSESAAVALGIAFALRVPR